VYFSLGFFHLAIGGFQKTAVAALSGLINRISGVAATLIYFLYAALTGLTLSSIFLVFTGSSIAEVFGVAAFGFAGLAIVGYVTKRDLGQAGSFCMLLAPFFLSARQWFFRRGGDPSRTQLRDPGDELHWNRFAEGELDRPLSQLIAPEFIFERREKRPRCGK
jgi:hypothetical protein